MKIDNLEVRLLNINDYDKGFLKCLSYLNSDVDLTVEEFIFIVDIRSRRNITTIVIEYDNKIIGTASFFIDYKFIHNGGKACFIEDVVVHELYQKLGIGSKLIDYIKDCCKTIECYKVVLYCESSLELFYSKNGFYYDDLYHMRYNFV